MRSATVFGGFLAVSSLLAMQTMHQMSAAEGEILARVGAIELKAEELRASLESLSPSALTVLARDPALLNQLVRSLLVQRLVLQQALAKQWEQRPEVTAQLEQVRQKTIVENYLDSVAAPPPGYPGEAEVRKSYEESRPALLVPRQLRLAQIYLRLTANADKSAIDKGRARLDAVRSKLRQRDADFAAIARAESDDKESADRGGEIGWLTEMQVQPEIRPSIVNLAKGAISEPIQLADGWHILQALDIKEAYTPTFDAVRSQLEQQLRTERAKADRQTYIAAMLKDNPVAINELALAEVLPPAEPAAATPSREAAANRAPRPNFK